MEEIRKLRESVQSLRAQTQPEGPDSAVGRLSRMDSLVNKGTAELALGDVQKRLIRLEGKLERIDDPDFGRCAQCDEWIPMSRLRAAPDRGICVSCLNANKS